MNIKLEDLSKEELLEYVKKIHEDKNEKYGLVWDREKEPEQIVVDCDKYIPILVSEENKNINNEGTNNLLIEGDNFHVLNALNYTHKEKINIIYIDPPYNTGNKDFIYNDKYIDEEDGYKHSKWLNFMEKRLKLAKELLKDDGLIFISIDDNEQAELKLLCNKIFGNNNYVENFIWCKNPNPTFLNKYSRSSCEYIICYAKNKENLEYLNGGIIESSETDAPLQNKGNPERILTIPEKIAECKFENQIIKKGKYGLVEILDNVAIKNGTNQNTFRIKGTFRLTQKTLVKRLKEGEKILFKSNKMAPRLSYKANKKISAPLKYIIEKHGTTQTGNNELKRILNNNEFSYPKPSSLIKYLITMYPKQDNITILDFFAGSGTTGQAVLELNKEDNKNRKFILCTNNENNICTNVTFPRLKTVITGKRTDGTTYSDGLNGSLKYFKTDFIKNINNRDQLYYDLTEKCITMLCIKEECYELIKSKKEYKIYSNKEKTKYTCVYYELFGTEENDFITELKNINEFKIIYKLSLGNYINEEKYKEIKNYSIESIPYRIVELYRKLEKINKEDE